MRKFSARLLAMLLTLTFIASCIIVLPASAIDINEIPPQDFVWELDFDKMSSITDNLGSTEYFLSLRPDGTNEAEFPLALTEKDGKKCLAIENGNGTYFIHDENNVLADYSTFFIEANMYFEQYPTMIEDSDSNHPNDYPLSFLTWMTKATASTTSYQYHSIRIDGDGYLCTKANNTSRTDVKLPLREWFNIRFVVSPSTKSAEVYLNGQKVLTYSLNNKVTTLADSIVRFFDTRYAYSVYFSDLSVYTASDYRIGLIDEVAADFVGYQTSKVQNNTFDLRVLAGLDELNYSNTGYEVVALRQQRTSVKTDEYSATSAVVYEEISALDATGAPIKVKASTLGRNYVSAISVPNLPANERMEIIIRPYAVQKGTRRYGDAMILVYTGEQKDGYPVLVSSKNVTSYTATASDDSFVRLQTKTSNGDATALEIKNNGKNSDYTREAFIKFTFNETAVERLNAASRIYLRCRVKNARALTADEQELGGILLDVYGTQADWNEKTLTYHAIKDIAADIEWVNEGFYRSGEYFTIDVTDYVLEHASEGAVSFRLENIDPDGSNDPARIYSNETDSPPQLIITTRLFGHEVNLIKVNNVGYEPWGYAEKIVDQWIAEDYDRLFGVKPYETIDLEAADLTTSNGEHTVKTDWKSNSPTNKWNSRVWARTLSTLKGYTPTLVSEYDQYGGITNSGIKGQATGFFHMEEHSGRTYIIDPLGNPFFAVGSNTVQLGATDNQKAASIDKYGSEENFYKGISEELRASGINTVWGGDWEKLIATGNLSGAVGIGCISAYMSALGLGVSTGGSAAFLHNNTMNVFDPDFVLHVRNKVETIVKPNVDNPYILGWYSDNEIPGETDMLYRYLTVDAMEPVNAYSYAAAWTFLVKRTGNPNPSADDVTPELSEEFKAFVYNRYYDVITSEIKKVDPNHMYMGNRIHSENKTSEGYLRAAGAYVDLLTVNLYGGLEPSIDNIKYMYRYSGKPFIVTEFFAKADDAVDMNGYSLGNQTNAGSIVKTQTDRANFFENYTLLLLESQTCVGWTWYRFRDNDQTIYQDDDGNLYRAYDYKDKKIYGYVNVETGELIDPAREMILTVFYKGEGDTSNLGSNKGIYDNHMNPYEELLNAHKNISDNIFGLIGFFDSRNNK